MKRSRFQFFLVFGLLVLLGVLAVFQYVWLGQISEAEKERVERRLQTDTERFGEDFNREIQSAYINFQFDESLWIKKDWTEFKERYDFWRETASYKDLIRDFYYFENKPDGGLLRYDWTKSGFAGADWTDELRAIRANTADLKNFQPADEERFALVMTIFKAEKRVDRIFLRDPKPAMLEKIAPTRIELPEKKGFLVIRLDEAVIKDRVLPDLVKKHFPEGDFNLAVTGKAGQKIFETREVTAADSSVRLFDLTPKDNFLAFANKDLLPRDRQPVAQGVVLNQGKIKSQSVSSFTESIRVGGKLPEKQTSATFQVRLDNNGGPRTIFQSGDPTQDGNWTLGVQHTAGSLDRFIANTRNRNLAISFGILGLLAVSIVLIFLSAYRARVLAQRQIDFVSSVSHEFRTPLAVIYSAGENLADGVAREEGQVSRYGDLIKNEGKKLSAMVEQILEFAGANSGKKKYDFREQDVGRIVENALEECRALIDEKGFAVETEIAENLPPVTADATALGQAIQNLIGNSLKYSNGRKWLKISAGNGGGTVRITVEDKGIGIAPKDLKHIFEPFFRAKAVVDEQIHGNGLGLSLVRETVTAHGGKITAESEPGAGSRFTIELPPGRK